MFGRVGDRSSHSTSDCIRAVGVSGKECVVTLLLTSLISSRFVFLGYFDGWMDRSGFANINGLIQIR